MVATRLRNWRASLVDRLCIDKGVGSGEWGSRILLTGHAMRVENGPKTEYSERKHQKLRKEEKETKGVWGRKKVGKWVNEGGERGGTAMQQRTRSGNGEAMTAVIATTNNSDLLQRLPQGGE